MDKIFQYLRNGKSLYGACENVGISTNEFYSFLAKNEKFRDNYLSSMADYADKCVDDIKGLVEELKKGEIDNSTAKLLIETTKWLVLKSQNDAESVLKGKMEELDDNNVREIMVKFI